MVLPKPKHQGLISPLHNLMYPSGEITGMTPENQEKIFFLNWGHYFTHVDLHMNLYFAQQEILSDFHLIKTIVT